MFLKEENVIKLQSEKKMVLGVKRRVRRRAVRQERRKERR
jgi:hypothetical protein